MSPTRLKWTFVALVIVGGLVWQGFRALFLEYVDATAYFHGSNPVCSPAAIIPPPEGTKCNPYRAYIDVHMDDPADIHCDVKGVTEDGGTSGSDSFDLQDVQGEVVHEGDLEASDASTSISEDLNIVCEKVG